MLGWGSVSILLSFKVAVSGRRSGSLPKHGHWDGPQTKDEGLSLEAKIMLVIVHETLRLNIGV